MSAFDKEVLLVLLCTLIDSVLLCCLVMHVQHLEALVMKQKED